MLKNIFAGLLVKNFGCQPDEPLASLVTTNRIINVYGFIVVMMLLIYFVLHCLYSVGNKITTTKLLPYLMCGIWYFNSIFHCVNDCVLQSSIGLMIKLEYELPKRIALSALLLIVVLFSTHLGNSPFDQQPRFPWYCICDAIYDECCTSDTEIRWFGLAGVGVTNPIPTVRYFSKISALPKHTVSIEYHVYVWQVSPQLSCGDTCQIWMWFKVSNR